MPETREKTVVITGANRGIGLELARIAAQRGAHVVAGCRDPGAAVVLRALAAQHPNLGLVPVVVDEPESVAALVAALDGVAVDVLINNAGTMGPPSDQQSPGAMRFDEWPAVFAVNTIAPLRLLQALRPNLAKAGTSRAVTITSQMGAIAVDMPFALAYCASKAAVNKVMRLIAPEYRDSGIIVSLVHPGWVRTDMGGADADIAPEESAAGIWAVIDRLELGDAGSFYSWTGAPHPW